MTITSLFGNVDPLTQLSVQATFLQTPQPFNPNLNQASNNPSILLAQSLLSLFLTPGSQPSSILGVGNFQTDAAGHTVSIGSAVDPGGNTVSTAQLRTSSGQTVGFQTAPPGGLPGLSAVPPATGLVPTVPTIIDANGSVVPTNTLYDSVGGAVATISLRDQNGRQTTYYSQVDSTGRSVEAVAGGPSAGATSTQLFIDSTGAALTANNNVDKAGNPVTTITLFTSTGAPLYYETQASDAPGLVTGSSPVLTTTAPAGATALPYPYNALGLQIPATTLYVTNGANVGAKVQEITLFSGGNPVNFFSVTNSSSGLTQPIALSPVPGATFAPQNLAPFSSNPALSTSTSQNQSLSTVLAASLLALALLSSFQSNNSNSLFGPTII